MGSTPASAGGVTGVEPAQDAAHKGNWLRRLLVVLLLVLPLTASVVYMWAMWDPRPYLEDVPLAVVNEDEGAMYKGEHRNFGQTTVDSLLGTEYLNFQEVSAEDAAKGLADTNYLFTVRIPKNFSADAVSVITENPRQAQIYVTENGYNGTAGAFLTNGVVPQIKARLNQTLTANYADNVLSGIIKLRDGLGRGADGAEKLDAGAQQLQAGATQLKDGTSQLTEGTGTLTNGTAQLKDGSGQLAQGAQQLANGTSRLSEGGTKLQAGTDQLADGMGQVSGGVSQLTSLLIPLLTQAQQVAPILNPVIDALRAVGMNAEADQLAGLLGKIDASNPENMVNKLGQLEDGAQQLHYNLSDPSAPYRGGLNQLTDGINTANDGAHRLSDGATRLNDGVVRLDDGAQRLNDGATRLDDGVTRLNDGTTRLTDGTGQLATGLREGYNKAPAIPNKEASAKQFGSPIVYTESNLHPTKTASDPSDPTSVVADSGASLLLMLVILGLIMFIIAILQPRPASVAGALRGFLVLALAGAGVALGLGAVSSALGWHPVSWPGIIAAMALVVLSNAAILSLVKSWFTPLIAGLVSFALFALGCFSFGGIWPVSTTPLPFRILRPLHWMSYQRDAFIGATQGDLGMKFWIAVTALAIFTLVAAGLMGLIGSRRRRYATTATATEPVSAA
ncbi:YhgE/Pip domain-containing protein [Corynebacterium tapiri]|uniref:YhgE/Pip domain-containing protein n=1 Tax=Corynebacterium tapiri TaxID=1448266 RepID=A0A5C4U177_9CORY|nr:YhgE/Pip domain-containing protein [Corynebacterium tapiri]TNL95072.1 YhgE/Pip domain-containing protein [Corynebacterium tapiri]